MGNRETANRVCVQDREQHVVHADAQTQDEDGKEGKASVPADQTEGETHVEREGVEHGQAPLIAIDGRHLIDAAESAARCRPGLRGRETFFEEISRQQVEMTADLLVEALVAFAPAENVRQARQEDFEGNHGSSHPSVDSQQDSDIAPVESQQGCGDRLPWSRQAWVAPRDG